MEILLTFKNILLIFFGKSLFLIAWFFNYLNYCLKPFSSTGPVVKPSPWHIQWQPLAQEEPAACSQGGKLVMPSKKWWQIFFSPLSFSSVLKSSWGWLCRPILLQTRPSQPTSMAVALPRLLRGGSVGWDGRRDLRHLPPWTACAVREPGQGESQQEKPWLVHLLGQGYHELAEVSAPGSPQNCTNSSLYSKQLIFSSICKCHPSCHTSQPSGSISCDAWINLCSVGRE